MVWSTATACREAWRPAPRTQPGSAATASPRGNLAANSNYALTYAAANLTITARPITVTADAQSRVYGDANPVLSYTIGGSGLVNGDELVV